MDQETKSLNAKTPTSDKILKRNRDSITNEEDLISRKSSLTPSSAGKFQNHPTSKEAPEAGKYDKILEILSDMKKEAKQNMQQLKKDFKAEIQFLKKENAIFREENIINKKQLNSAQEEIATLQEEILRLKEKEEKRGKLERKLNVLISEKPLSETKRNNEELLKRAKEICNNFTRKDTPLHDSVFITTNKSGYDIFRVNYSREKLLIMKHKKELRGKNILIENELKKMSKKEMRKRVEREIEK